MEPGRADSVATFSLLIRRAVGMVLLATVGLAASAATTRTVFDVERPGGFIRVLLLTPENPVATLIMLTGGDGVLGLELDGSATMPRYSTNPPSRNTQRFLDLGYAVAHVDAISGSDGLFLVDRLTSRHFADLEVVVQQIRARVSAPPWIVGYSAGTISATNLAVNLPGSPAPGVILLAPVTMGDAAIFGMNLQSIRRPVFILTHPLDSCSTTPPANAPLVLDMLTSAPMKQHVSLAGGVGDIPGCDARGHHGWAGLDAELVAQIATWVVRGASLISPGNHTALWWNAAESGWGINVNHQGDIVFATLFTYDSSGQPMWLVMSAGQRTGGETFSGPLYRTTGPVFNANPFTPIGAGNVTQVGTMTLSFSGDSATLSYSVNGVPVSKNITKQVYGSRGASCTTTTGSRSGSTNYQDLWWNAAESGWGLNITHQDNTLFGTLFTYGSNNQGMWLVMSNGTRQSDGSYFGDLFRTTGPAFNASPWTGVNVARVGTMRLRFTNGESAILEYSVDGVNVTKTITRQVFSTPLPLCG